MWLCVLLQFAFVHGFWCLLLIVVFFFFKQKTAYEMRISDWSSDVCSSDLLELEFRHLLPPAGLHGIAPAAQLVVDAIRNDEPIVIAGDYDCDGATGVAVAVSGLTALGARRVDYVVPDRFRMGYGLSPA